MCRSTHLSTVDLYRLDLACRTLWRPPPCSCEQIEYYALGYREAVAVLPGRRDPDCLAHEATRRRRP